MYCLRIFRFSWPTKREVRPGEIRQEGGGAYRQRDGVPDEQGRGGRGGEARGGPGVVPAGRGRAELVQVLGEGLAELGAGRFVA